MPTKKSPEPKKKSSDVKKKPPVEKSKKPSEPKKKSPTNRLFQKIRETTGAAESSQTRTTSAKEIDSIRGESSKAVISPKDKKPSKKAPKTSTAIEAAKPLFDEKDILPLLKLPFAVSSNITGYKYEMPKDYEPILKKTGAQLVKDFGIEAVSKWVNLGIFAGIYGSCVFTWLRGTKEHMELQAREIMAKRKVAAQEPTPKDEAPPPMPTPPPASPPPVKVVKIVPFESTMDAAAAAVKDAG